MPPYKAHLSKLFRLSAPVLPVLLFGLLWLAAIYVRLAHILTVGLQKGDAICYWRAGVEWAAGNFHYFDITGTGRPVYRPVSFLLYGLVTRLLGPTDYAIKLLNGLADSLNILLIFLIAIRITRSRWLALCPVILYAFSPNLVELVRGEYVHAHSATFVLLAIYCFLSYVRHKNLPARWDWISLGLSGFLIGAAAHTHEELAVLVGPFIFMLALDAAALWRRKHAFRRFAAACGLFCFAFLMHYALWSLIYRPEEVTGKITEKIEREASVLSAPGTSPPFYKHGLDFLHILDTVDAYYFGEYSFHAGIAALGISAFMAAATAAWCLWRGKRVRLAALRWLYFPFVLYFAYASLVAIAKPDMGLGHGRLFIPVAPFLFLGIAIWFKRALRAGLCAFAKRRGGNAARGIWAKRTEQAIMVLLVLGLAASAGPIMPWNAKLGEPNPRRVVYDIMKNRVDSQNRILLTPHLYYALDNLLTSDLYLGDGARYLYRQPFNQRSFEDLVDKHDIRYILVAKTGLDNRIADRTKKPTYYGFGRTHYVSPGKGPEEYSLKREYAFLSDYLEKRGARLIYEGEIGTIYEIAMVDYRFLKAMDEARIESSDAGAVPKSIPVLIEKKLYDSILLKPGETIVFPPYTVRDESSLLAAPYVPKRFWESSAPVMFRISARRADGSITEIYSQELDPKNRPEDQQLAPVQSSLQALAGETVQFEFRVDSTGAEAPPHGLWVDPKILAWRGVRRIDFTDAESDPYVGKGWGNRGRSGRWSIDEYAALHFNLEHATDPVVSFYGRSFGKQKIGLELNGHPAGYIEMAGARAETVRLSFPASYFQKENTLVFHLPDRRSPASVGEGQETALLGVLIARFDIQE